MESADEYYSTKTKDNEEKFLKELEEGKDFEKAEKDYLKKSKAIRKEYERKFGVELRKKELKKVKKKKKEKDKKFIIEHVNLEESEYQRLRYMLAVDYFRAKRELSQLTRLRAYNFFLYIFFRIKYFFKGISLSNRIFKDKMSKRWTKFKAKAKVFFNKTKALLKTLKGKMQHIASRKKKQKKDGNKKEDDKKESDTKEGSTENKKESS